jgi:hypothetical protein
MRLNYRRLLVVLALGVTLASSVFVTSAFARGGGPPNGIYTCDWIAAHPAAAAQAQVTCDASVFFAGLSGQTTAPTTSSASTPSSPDTIDANGCQNVPNGGGRVGKGVWAWSLYEYSNQWSWYGRYSPSWYTFYIQKTDGTNYVYGPITDTSTHSIGIGANVYRWGAQNHSDTAQNWYVCYYTV